MKINRKIIEIDEELCNGCGQCVPSCAEGALQIIDGKAKLVAEVYCDGLGACLGECPTGALKIVEREAEDFDEKAVEGRLRELEKEDSGTNKVLCPSGTPQILSPGINCKNANEPVNQKTAASALSHWPVQIRLVPPNAPFLKGADLLVVADCAALSYAGMHKDFIAGKAVMMGCPKFDNAPEYIQKFTDIFNTADIKSITVPIMDVPCCQGLPVIIQKALERSGKQIPLKKVVISRQGEVISSEEIS
ncbi:MAG: 4Fe-4S binding protein [Desulfobacteraceae bacterium]|jgi:NAD-dependent dihydropyrimidine dehydrogenase PreA subunit